MPRIQEDLTGFACWRVLPWSGLMASALLLASLVQAVATGSTAGAVESVPTPIQPPDASCEMAARQPLYTGQNSWVTQSRGHCTDLLP